MEESNNSSYRKVIRIFYLGEDFKTVEERRILWKCQIDCRVGFPTTYAKPVFIGFVGKSFDRKYGLGLCVPF